MAGLTSAAMSRPAVAVTLTEHGRALMAEAAGTFMFVSIGAGSVVANEMTGGLVGLVGIALAHGLALAVAMSAFGAISGGHFNPAVTLGLAIARKHPRERILTYWGAQLAGGLAAGVFLRIAFDHAQGVRAVALLGTPGLAPGLAPLTGIFIELVLTVFLLWAFFGTVVSPDAPRIAGFGVGLAVTADILMGGPLTGASMNPTRWFGPAVASGQLRDAAVHVIGPFVGAAIAGASYLYVFGNPAEREVIEIVPPASPAARASDRTERL